MIVKGEDVSYIVILLTMLFISLLHPFPKFGIRKVLLYKYGIKVAGTHPPLPLDNINNYKYIYPLLIDCAVISFVTVARGEIKNSV